MTDMRALYPEIEPYAIERLRVSDLHEIVYEEAGNPTGQPAVFLHGGPGVGILPDYRRFFDPEFYRIVLPDQRGSGRSTPHASLEENTTWHIVEDLERLRLHLGLDRWVVMGGSWGSTLALCYAITYPESVRGLIIRGVFLGTDAEKEWLFSEGGASEVFPDGWEEFAGAIPEGERDDLVAAYYRRLTSGDEAEMHAAAMSWSMWEGRISTLLPDEEFLNKIVTDHSALSIGRAECHYTYHDFFLQPDTWILDNANRLDDIPVRIVQGRYDIICPVSAAWRIHGALANSDLRIVPDGSHSPLEPGMVHELVEASEDFKSLFG